MANEIKIQKTVFDKEQFKKVVNNEFTTFVQPAEEDTGVTVAEFFENYRTLYYEIPLTGDNSHTTIIEESSKLVDFERDSENIQPLLDEIANLREQNNNLNQQVFELTQQTATTT